MVNKDEYISLFSSMSTDRSVYLAKPVAYVSDTNGAASSQKYALFSLLGRLFDRVDLIKPVSNVRPSVHKVSPISIQLAQLSLTNPRVSLHHD